MKTGTNLRWVGCLLIVCAGGLFGCDGAKPNESNSSDKEANTQSQVAIDQEPSEIDESEPLVKKFNPKSGRRPKDENDYIQAIAAIKNYRKKRPNEHIHDHYFNKDLAREIINQPRVEGLRIYRVDSVRQDGKPAVGIIVVGVDKDGNDVQRTSGPGTSGLVGDYMMSISYEKCPRNCEGTRIFDQN